MNKKVLAVALAAFSLAMGARAANEQIMVNYQSVMDSEEGKSHIDPGVKLVFGPNTMPAGAKSLGTVTINKISKGANRRDFEGSCKKVVVESLAELQQKARAAGGDAVVNIISKYHESSNLNPTAAECHAGGTGGHLTLQGEFVKLK